MFFAVVGMAMAMCLTGCGEPSLNTYVRRYQQQLPVDLGEGSKLTTCGIVDNYLEFEMTNDEQVFALDDEDALMVFDLMSAYLKQDFMQEEAIQELLGACKKDAKGFRIMMQGERSGARKALVDFTPEELLANDSIPNTDNE